MLNPPRTVIRGLAPRLHPHWATLLAAALATSLTFTVQPARAGRFHVYSCRTPNGSVAPTDGWVGSRSPESASVVAVDTCSSGGALTAALKDGIKHEVGAYSRWTFTALSGEPLVGATLWRSGDTEGGAAQNATYDFTEAGPALSEIFGECVYVSKCTGEVGTYSEPLSALNQVPVPAPNVGGDLYVTAACGGLSGYLCPEGEKDPNGDAAVVYVYAADLLLEQTAQPSVTPGSVTGELATDTKLRGTASVLFEAADPASGVYRAVVEVDGEAVGATALDSNGGHCTNVGQTSDGLPAFLYLRPCAAGVSADVPLDTTSLSNGSHRIVVSVTDAAGNSATVLDRTVEVANSTPVSPSGGSSLLSGQGGPAANGGSLGSGSVLGGSVLPGAPNGAPALGPAVLEAHWGSSGRTALSSRWGRTRAIDGRLRATSGAPIAGAILEASATPTAQGARSRAIGSPRTRADGSFSVTVPAHACSEQIVLAYRAHAGDALPVAVQTLTLTVPASLSLSVAPRSSHVGGAIRFSGVLRGAPIPAGGKQLALQASSPGAGWRTFQVLSTNRRGRYRSSYRFRLPGPVTYRFRALSRREADFPFASGSSNVIVVRER